jgi:hypothetical protein
MSIESFREITTTFQKTEALKSSCFYGMERFLSFCQNYIDPYLRELKFPESFCRRVLQDQK